VRRASATEASPDVEFASEFDILRFPGEVGKEARQVATVRMQDLVRIPSLVRYIGEVSDINRKQFRSESRIVSQERHTQLSPGRWFASGSDPLAS